ncbi:MAG: branched-chain amino acid ABC transporter permease [Deltaproteobacteria bacterium]|nr:branched-chain amino acid ABC transporter permease [Deltaproteobacteria bacterium]
MTVPLDFSFAFQQLVYGLTLGCLYGLLAIGYSMVYGVLRLINFAHGDLLMVSAYFAFFGMVIFQIPWPVSFIGSVLFTAILGILIDRGAYRPIRKSPRINALITAIGVSFLLENLGLVLIGGRPKSFPLPALFEGSFVIGAVNVPALSIWTLLVTLVLLVVCAVVVKKTRIGMAMRALSRDMETVMLMGIDKDRVISFTFALGSAMAAAGGIMWCMKYPAVEPFMGVIPGLKAFVAAVLGGIGNITGAALGGLILGLIEVLFVAVEPDWSGYRDAVSFFLMIVILLTRPTGIMGERLPD